jgi:Capsular polysaccharide synthesis, CpsB/CapC
VIDLHCHILPGIDDGAGELADSIAMAQQAARRRAEGGDLDRKLAAASVAVYQRAPVRNPEVGWQKAACEGALDHEALHHRGGASDRATRHRAVREQQRATRPKDASQLVQGLIGLVDCLDCPPAHNQIEVAIGKGKVKKARLYMLSGYVSRLTEHLGRLIHQRQLDPRLNPSHHSREPAGSACRVEHSHSGTQRLSEVPLELTTALASQQRDSRELAPRRDQRT